MPWFEDMKIISVGHVLKGSVWLALSCALLAGCATGNYKPVVRFGQLNLETQVPRQDLVILDAVEGTSREDAYVLGLVRIIDRTKWKVLGIKFFEDHCACPYGPSVPCFFVDAVSARAYYNALAKAPEADAVIECSSTSRTRGCTLLYQMKEITYRGKAIRLKTQ
jgi:hypothetical protein